jgi:CheY-like chemotaxis protein
MAQADPLRILLIDDDPVLLQTLTDALDLYGFQTLASGSGAEGLAQVVARKPACVVVDIRMPEINGYQFVRALRGDPATVAIPIVILSALAQEHEHEQLAGMLTGADAYLLKPVAIAQLVKVITEAISSSAEAREQRQRQLLNTPEERAP